MAARSTRLIYVLPSLTDVAFLLPVSFLFAGMDGTHTLLADGDTGWHIRAGEWMLRHGAIPRRDLFSFTRPEGAWFAWEWLAEMAMAGLHRLGGLAAVTLAATLLLGLTFALVYRLLRARSGNVLVAIGLAAVAAAASSIHWLARPHLVTLLFTVLFLSILESGRRLWLLPLLMLPWTNMHAGFLFGLLLVAGWMVAARTAARARVYGMSLAACLLATLANPYGWRLHLHVLRYLTADAWQFGHIHEFQSPSFHHPRAMFFELMLALALICLPWHLRRRRWHYALLPLLAAHLALVSARHIPLFMLVAATPVAVAAAEWLRGPAAAAIAAGPHRLLTRLNQVAAETGEIDRQARLPLASLLAASLLALALFQPAPAASFRAEFDPRVFPAHALDMLGAAQAPARIFTSDQWGDYLIYRLYPKIRVFVDGRSDFYGGDLEQTCQNVLNVRYDWQELLGRYRVDTVLLPAEAPLAGALKQSGRWLLVYDDSSALLFRRREGEPVSGGEMAVAGPPESQQITLRSELK